MSMPIRMAQNLVEGGIQALNKVSPNMAEAQIGASTATIVALTDVRNRLERLIAGGYQLDKLRSALLLCSEAIRQQDQIRQLQGNQKSRLLALKAGLNEVR